MSSERRRAISTPGETPGERGDPVRRGPASAIVSVAVHIVAIAILVRIAIVPLNWLGLSHPEEPQTTHVNFIQPAADSGAHQRAGGDNRRVTNGPVAAPLVSPSSVPSTLPPEPPPKPAEPAAPAESGTGAVIGGGGPTKGVTPAFVDPRIWGPSDPAFLRPKTTTERLDSAISARVHHVEDSLIAIGAIRAPGDWTMKGKDGKKYGIDQKYIQLGNFRIPTALLALLPLNVQGNPTTYENAKRIGLIRAEILNQEARSARDDAFNSAVKELRERKQKERADKALEDATIPVAPPLPKIIP